MPWSWKHLSPHSMLFLAGVERKRNETIFLEVDAANARLYEHALYIGTFPFKLWLRQNLWSHDHEKIHIKLMDSLEPWL